MSLTHMQTRLDAPTVGAFQRSLEYVESEVIKVKYPQFKAAEGLILPIEELNIPWAEFTTFRMMDGVGSEFELADDMTTNLSFVDVLSEEFSQRIYTFRKGYFFTEKEVYRSAHLGMPIEQQKIQMVRQLYMQTLNRLVLFGEPRIGMPGLINHPAWLRSAAPYPLTSASTVAQMLATLNAGPDGITKASQQTEMADTLLLPKTRYDFLTSQARLDNTLERTILPFFINNNSSIRNIDWLSELENAGPNGEPVAIFYTRNPRAVKASITKPMTMGDLVIQPTRVVRPVSFDYNGLKAYVPFSVHVMIGV